MTENSSDPDAAERATENFDFAAAPLVSIIIPTFNRAGLLCEMLASLRAQTYAQWEAIVVDDHSTDDTCERVAGLSRVDPRIRFFRRDREPKGAPTCRNIGFERSGGSYVVFFDSDDLMAPVMFAQRVAFMERHPDVDFVVCRIEMFNFEPGDLRRLFNTNTGEDDLDRFLGHDNPWPTLGPTWRRGALEQIGPWDERLACGQDVDYHTRAIILGLRYERLDACDAFIRTEVDNREKIARDVMAPRLLPSQRLRVRKAVEMLDDRGVLTATRRNLAAANYLAIAEGWRDDGRIREALGAWGEARRLGLIGRRDRWVGALYLLLRRGWMGSIVFASMHRRWPRDRFLGYRASMCRFRVHQSSESYTRSITNPLHRYYRFREIVTDGTLRFIARRLSPMRWTRAIGRRLSDLILRMKGSSE